MASNLKNLLPSDRSWLLEVSAEDPSDLERYLNNENHELHDHSREFKLPDVIGILPIRNAVAYPGTVTPLAIGRKRSKALLANTEPNESIIGLVTQRNPQIDTPDFENHIVVHGIARFRIIEKIAVKPYLKARVQPLTVKVRTSRRLQALIVNVRQAANRVIALNPSVPEEASVLLENIEDPSALADFLAANLSLGIPEKQQLLEELDATKRLEKISVALANQLEVLELSHKIQGRVRESIDKSQREYFLQEQLKAIQTELGKGDRQTLPPRPNTALSAHI